DVESMSLAKLISKKEEIKSLLIEYDRWFYEQHRRKPRKPEKERIRPYYEYYHATKKRIAALDKCGGLDGSWVVVVSSGSSYVPGTNVPQRRRYDILAELDDLSQLKAELFLLRSSLRVFEKDFVKTHGRQVSTPSDIKPKQKEYARYKKVAKMIKMMEAP
ncbi:expressed unknown protein (Partial), partial [Seminavis robusta]